MAGRTLPKIPKRDKEVMDGELHNWADLTSIDLHSIQLSLAEYTQLLDPDNNARGLGDIPEPPAGWDLIDFSNNTATGFQGYAFRHIASNSLIIVNTPTQFKPLDYNDIITDAQGAIPGILSPAQLDDAISFAARVFGDNPADLFTNIYFPSFSLANALSMAQMHYAYAMGWLDQASVSHISMGSAYFGTDIDDALARNGVFIDAVAKRYVAERTTHYLDTNDVVTTTRFNNGSEGEIVIVAPLYLQDSLGGFHLVTDVAAHAGRVYIWRRSQMERLGLNSMDGYATIVYADASGKSQLKLVPQSEVTLVLPPGSSADSIALLPEGYILDSSEIRTEGGNSISVRGVTINGDYVNVVSEDIDGDGIYDQTTKTYSYAWLEKPTTTYTYRKYSVSPGSLSDNDYVYVGRLVVDLNHNGVAERTQTVSVRGGLKVSKEETYDETTGERTFKDDVEFGGVNVSQIGSAFGSALGNVLFDDQLERILGSSILQAVGGNLAESLGFLAIGQSGVEAMKNSFNGFLSDIGSNIAGAISSYLVAEVIHAAGLDGTIVGDLGQSLAAQTLTQIVTNIATQVPAFQGVTLSLANIGTIFATYIGTKLASEFIEFDTVEGQIGASLGSAIGTYVGASYFAANFASWGAIAGPVGALVGAFFGYILGGLIGSIFAQKPRSGADLSWDREGQRFVTANVWARGNASEQSARGLADAVAGNINGALDYVGARLLDAGAVRTGNYGLQGKDFVYRLNGQVVFRTRDADQLVNHGTFFALSSMSDQLAGGDIHAKRALVAHVRLYSNDSEAFSMETLLGDLGIASDYAKYIEDPTAINALIAAEPSSAFAAGWAATFARVLELGLNKRSSTDWVGGYAVLLDELPDGLVDGEAFSAGNLIMDLNNRKERVMIVRDGNGVELGTLSDSIELDSKDVISGSAGNDRLVISIDQFESASEFTVNGQAGVASNYLIDVAAVIDGGAGNDLLSGGNLGNDLLGGAGDDVVIGGKLDDWLFGDEGDDVLFSGVVSNYAFLSSDLAAEASAVAADGGNGNYLYGGEGNDRLYGGSGSDWLRGGGGNDRLVGGAGGDVLEGSLGDDRGAGGGAAIFGGAGSDSYLFGRGHGKDVILDEADPADTSGVSRDSISWRIQQIDSGFAQRNWAGGGDYQVDGSVKGGEDAIAFGAGLTMANLLMRRSGNSLQIQLVSTDADGNGVLTGDELTIQDWFESTRRVEWLRFANGEEIRIGDMTSFVIGTEESDVILGSYGADFLYGGGGDDEIRGLAGNDFGNGGAGNDFVAGDGDNDWVLGGSGDDQVIGGAGHDTAFGDDGNDRVYGGTGSDLVVGGRGDDEVVGGAGDDVFRYTRGDGRDVVMDDYVNNWDLVYQSGGYVNGYVLQANGTVTKNDVVYFDGSKWLGQYDWNDEQKTLRRHAGAVNGLVASNAGVDTLEFAVGIDIQDLMLQKAGNDLQVAVAKDNDASGFDQVADRITIKDWYALGAPIENFVFAATGRHAVSAMTLGGGTDGDDTLAGTAGKDWLTGNGGDDVVDGGVGADILAGNAGFDLLRGGADVDVLFGGSGNDTLDGGAGADLLFGGDGDDVASYATSGVAVRAYLDAAAAASNTGDAQGDVYTDIEGLQGSAGDDRLGGDGGDNTLDGGAGNDALYGGAGSDTYLFGRNSGTDTIREGNYALDQSGQEVVQSGDEGGIDLLSLEDGISLSDLTLQKVGSDLRVTVGAASALLVDQSVAGRGVEQLQLADGLMLDLARLKFAGDAATAGDDVLLASLGSVNDLLDGLGGDDIVSGGLGNDQLRGGDGNDTLEGGDGADTLDGGSDSVTLAAPLEAGSAYGDTARYAGSNAAVAIDLAALTATGGHAAGDVLVALDGFSTIENVVGSAFDDALGGDARANRLSGFGGNDVLDGRAGDDVLVGGAGNDTLYGGAGADALSGEDGADRLEGGADKDLLSGGGGDDVLFGDADDDQLTGDAGNDILYGGTGNDTVGGWDGNDTLYGEDGDDKLAGGGGNDTIEGGAGADQISGEAGNDQLRGGAGSDSYLFDASTGIDTIVDAGNASDRNKIFITDASPDRIWLARAGDDLRISVIGGSSLIIVSGYFKADQSGSRIHEIATSGGSLFLKYADPLIQAMAQASASLPAVMPQAIAEQLAAYWHTTGKAVPSVADQSVMTDEDVAISGQVAAVDHDDNITEYAVHEAAAMGSVVLDAATGAWTYTPGANRHGTDRFVIAVTDADGNRVLQTVSVAVASINDAPSDIFAPVELAIDEGSANGVALGGFTHLDNDGPQDTGTFTLIDSAGGRFAISSDGVLTVLDGNRLDYEAQTTHTIVVRVTDLAGAWFEKQFTVDVRNVNEKPYIVAPPPETTSVVVSENTAGTIVATFVIGDPDGIPPMLELVQNPYGWLETVGSTVRVRSGAVIDFEALAAAGVTFEDTDGDGIREIRLIAAVRASDGEHTSSVPTSFVFFIEDANEAPTGITFSPVGGAIAERDRPAEGSHLPAILLGTLSALDPDIFSATDFATLVFSVADTRFEIVNGNELRLRAGAALDFETGQSINLVITVTDRGGQGFSYNHSIVLTVSDQDDYAYGTVGADTLIGQANRDVMRGYGGDDNLQGLAGNDDLYGGEGADRLSGDDGDDRLWGELGDDILVGGAGNDALTSGDGNDQLQGDAGDDSLLGESGNDTLNGGDGDDLLDGGIGDDVLRGGQGADRLLGGAGNDTVDGGAGADRMQGGDGFDTLTYESALQGITLNLQTPSANTGAAAGDSVDDHFEKIIGTAFDDSITATNLGDEIHGGAGNDVITGGAGADRLYGGDGNDTLSALGNNDVLMGGRGNDILIGGLGSDTYLMDRDSGVDLIRNYDPSGNDIDAIGYDGILRHELWFERLGNDLIITVIGTSVRTSIEGWYVKTNPFDRANYKIDFIIAGNQYSSTVNAEGLVALMAGYTKPADMNAFDALHRNLQFENRWINYWDATGAPVIGSIANQSFNEDGSLTVQIQVSDDITPYDGLTLTATANNKRINAPSLSPPDANGVRMLTLTGAPNQSGDVIVTVRATDPGGLWSERTFVVSIAAVADRPLVTKAVQIDRNLETGSMAIDIQAALVDTDGSEVLEVRISNVPTALGFNQGTYLGDGIWSFTSAQLVGLKLTGPTNWTQNLDRTRALRVTAISRELSTGATATYAGFTQLKITFSSRPTDITPDRTLSVDESTAADVVATGTVVAQFSSTVTGSVVPTYSLVNNAGGRFQISTTGKLSVANGSAIDYENSDSYVIRVRSTGSGGQAYEEDFTIAVNNRNEAPTIPMASVVAPLVAENANLSNALVATLQSTDPEGTPVSYTITDDFLGLFMISGSTLVFRPGIVLNFEALVAMQATIGDIDNDGRKEAVYSVKVYATDGAFTSPNFVTISIRVEDVNDAPNSISPDRALSIAENSGNGALVANFAAGDQDIGDGLYFSLLDGAGGRFALNSAGALTVVNGGLLNYEAAVAHTITVRVTDQFGAVKDQQFQVSVGNVNETPSDPVVSQYLGMLQEGVTTAQTFATYSASDPDGTAPAFYESLDAWDWFQLSGSSLQLRAGLNMDFESLVAQGTAWWNRIEDSDGDGQLEFGYLTAVKATDGSLNSVGDGWAWLRVEDVNEAPVLSAQTFSVAESAPGAGQTLVGNVAVSDPDSQSYNRDFRYSLTGGDTGRFSINQTTGQIYLQGGLNYEAASSHQIQVTVRDRSGSGLSATQVMTINVANVNEAPVLSNYLIGMSGTTTYHQVIASDPDGDALTYRLISISSSGSTWVNVSNIQAQLSASGTLSIQNMPRLPYTEAEVDFRIEVRDSSGLLGIGTLTVKNYSRGSSSISPVDREPQTTIIASLAPVVVDLDGDGVELLSQGSSSVRFDMNQDGALDSTGWVGADDGLLVLDRNADGRITDGGEISFVGDMDGAYSDLEGLVSFDTSGNGLLDGADARFSEFQVWRDQNQNGVSEAEELFLLADLSIESIALTGVRTGLSPEGANDNVVYAISTFRRSDGSGGEVGDVFLAYGYDQGLGQAPYLNIEGLDLTDRGVTQGTGNAQVPRGDLGTGDASAGKVYRGSASAGGNVAAGMPPAAAAPAQAIVPTSRRDRSGPANEELAKRRDDEPRHNSPADSQTEQEATGSTAQARSALHDQLALSQKKRFQMIEAMSAFAADPYAQFGLGTGKDLQAVELLTALPDFRISA